MTGAVNLNRFRKARRKAEKAATAAANRAKHGRTKAEKARDAAAAIRPKNTVDGARLDGQDAE